MTQQDKHVSLPEEDYLAILDVINQFNKCNSRSDLKNAFKSHLLPLFQAQAGLYVWTDPDFNSPQIIDAVNIPQWQLDIQQKVIPYDTVLKLAIENFQTVIAHDVDLPRSEIQRTISRFKQDNPDLNPGDTSYMEQMNSTLVAFDDPTPSMGLGCHRLIPNEKPFTVRDVRILELLRPHIFHSIKSIVLSEELVKFRSISTALAEIPTGITVVSPDMRIIFGNEAFKALIPCQPGQRLPKDLGDLIMKEMDQYEPPYHAEDSVIEIPFYNMDKNTYRLSITLLKGRGLDEDRCYLLRLKPVIEPYSKMNVFMQEKGLTGREMEVCMLVRNGFDNKDISARLFISPNTVKNHLRNIHRKLDVQTRTQLIALLNTEQDMHS